MKIGIIFSEWSTGKRPLDFHNLEGAARGLTGSDLGMVMVAQELASLGHEVHIYTSHESYPPAKWKGVSLHYFTELSPKTTQDFDALISWSDPNPFLKTSDKPLRVVYQMLNDFSYAPDAFKLVDLCITVSQELHEYLATKPDAPPPSKWAPFIPLGCDPSWYHEARVPGRVVWTSSADRGLHLVLQEWPEIKKAVPNATLRVFYNFNYGDLVNLDPTDANMRTNHPTIVELAHRVRYMLHAMKVLKPFGVEHVGSISRDQMAQEMSEAMVLAYPVSTVAFTEGFSVSILEACAAGVVPVIAATDCIGGIYWGTCPMVATPPEHHIEEWRDLVIKGLTDEAFRQETLAKTLPFAAERTWAHCAKRMEQTIITKLMSKETVVEESDLTAKNAALWASWEPVIAEQDAKRNALINALHSTPSPKEKVNNV